MVQHLLKLKSFANDALPEQYKAFPELAAAILGEHMMVDFIDGCRLDRENNPLDILIVASAGLLVGELEESYNFNEAGDDEHLEVTFHPWREVKSVIVAGETVRFHMKDNSRPGPSVDVYAPGTEEGTAEQAQKFFAQAVGYMTGKTEFIRG